MQFDPSQYNSLAVDSRHREANKLCNLNLIIMVVKVLRLELEWALVFPDKLPCVLVPRSLFWRILHEPGH